MSVQHDITTGGIAALATGSERTTSVHGVILGPGDVTNGLSGKRTRWPAAILEAMAEDGLFEGKPITLADSLDPEQHVGVEATDDGARVTAAVSMDEKMGEVTRTAFDSEAGLVFEGFVMDWVADELVETGLAQVSPVIARELEQIEDGDDPLFEPTSVEAARDLALVADGAAPSNEITVGSLDAGVAEALSTHFGVDVSLEALSVSRPDFNGYSEAAWDAPTLEGTFDGDMESARNSATWIENDGENFGDLSLFIIDGEGDLNLNALDSAWTLASQTDGPTEDDVERLRSMYEGFAVQANEAGAMTDDEFDNVWQDRVADDVEAGAAWIEALGESLGGQLSDLLDDRDEDRSVLVDELADAAGVESGTANAIIRGEIECPPAERLRSMADVLDVDQSTLFDAAREDGCEYDNVEAGTSTIDHPGGDDGPDGGSGQSTPVSGWRSAMTDDDLTDKERELLAVAGQKDDPTVVDAEVLEQLDTLEANEALIDAAMDLEDPTVVSETEYEEQTEALSEFRSFFKEALAEQKGVDSELLQDDAEALTSAFRDDEGDLDYEALTQSVETGSGPTSGHDVSPDDDEVAEVLDEYDASNVDEGIEILRERHEQFEEVGWDTHVERTESELETLGVEL